MNFNWDKAWWRLSRKTQAYRSLEGAHGWPIVIADLAQFCHYNRPLIKVNPVTNAVDPIAMAVAAGRHEVFLRIKEMIDTNDVKIRGWMHDEMAQMERISNENNSEFDR
jgi:hypothetical protein